MPVQTEESNITQRSGHYVRSNVQMQWVYWVLEGVTLSTTNEFV